MLGQTGAQSRWKPCSQEVHVLGDSLLCFSKVIDSFFFFWLLILYLSAICVKGQFVFFFPQVFQYVVDWYFNKVQKKLITRKVKFKRPQVHTNYTTCFLSIQLKEKKIAQSIFCMFLRLTLNDLIMNHDSSPTGSCLRSTLGVAAICFVLASYLITTHHNMWSEK